MKKTLILLIFAYCFNALSQEENDSVRYFNYLESTHNNLIKGKEERSHAKKILKDVRTYQKSALNELDSIERSLRKEKGKLIVFEELHFKKEQNLKRDLEAINTKSIAITKKEGLISLNKEKKNILTPRTESKKNELSRAKIEEKEIKSQINTLTTQNQKEKRTVEVIVQSLALREATNAELANEIADLRSKNSEISVTVKEKENKLEQDRLKSIDLENETLTIGHKIEQNSQKINDDIGILSEWRSTKKSTDSQISKLENSLKLNKTKLYDTTLNLSTKEEIRNLISQDNTNLITNQQNYEKQEQEIIQLTSEIENVKNENNNLRKEKENKGQEIVQLKGEISSKKREIKRLNEKIKYNELEITEKSNLRNKFLLEIENQQNQRGALNSKINANTITINDYKAEATDLDIKIKSLNTEIATLENKLSDIDVENQSLGNEITILSNEVETLKGDVNKLKPELEKISSDLRQEKKRIHSLESELKIDREKVNELKHEADSINTYASKLENQSEDLLIAFIKTHQQQNKDSIALKYSLIQNHNNAKTEAIMGYSEIFKNHPDRAIEYLSKSIKINSNEPEIILLRANISTRQKNYLGAIKDYDQVLYLNESNKTALLERGKIYLVNLNDRENGCADMKNALDKGYFESNIYLEKYCSNSGDVTEHEIHQLTKVATKHSYGFTKDNPIKVGQTKGNPNKNMVDYLKLLYDSKGNPITFAKAGRCCPYKTENGINGEGLLDTYKLFYRDEKGKKTETKLFFTIYDYELPKVPIGFKTEHEIY